MLWLCHPLSFTTVCLMSTSLFLHSDAWVWGAAECARSNSTYVVQRDWSQEYCWSIFLWLCCAYSSHLITFGFFIPLRLGIYMVEQRNLGVVSAASLTCKWSWDTEAKWEHAHMRIPQAHDTDWCSLLNTLSFDLFWHIWQVQNLPGLHRCVSQNNEEGGELPCELLYNLPACCHCLIGKKPKQLPLIQLLLSFSDAEVIQY